MRMLQGFALSLIVSNLAFADDIRWTYQGLGNPEQWGKLKPDFILCEIGKNQTPINLIENEMIEAELLPIEFSYKNAIASVVNNGHAIQINYPQGSSISIEGKVFNLMQFHFHTPSENKINGKSFPLELHLVHKSDKAEIAVIGIMFDVGNTNEMIDSIWKKVSSKENEEIQLEQELNLMNLLPEDKSYFRFNGSLTVPPCSEGVRWFVMKKPLTASQAQIYQFKGWMKHDNARPLQSINARPILK
jgi:carbonic anhydrase